MFLLQRIKNLIEISKFRPTTFDDKTEIGDVYTNLKKPIDSIGYKYNGKPQGQIIKRKLNLDEEVKELLKDE